MKCRPLAPTPHLESAGYPASGASESDQRRRARRPGIRCRRGLCGAPQDACQLFCAPVCVSACVPACLRACVRACVPACLRACVPACLRACQCAPAWHLRVRRRLPHRESMSGNDRVTRAWAPGTTVRKDRATRAWAPGTRAGPAQAGPAGVIRDRRRGGLHVAQLAQSLRKLAGDSRIQVSADEVKAAAIAS